MPESAYSFAAQTPVRITVAWNLTGPASSPAVWIFFDKVEASSYSARAQLPIATPKMNTATGKIFVGADSGVDPVPAMGLIDDFKIYGASIPPK